MSSKAPKLEIFFGSPPAERTERELLTRLVADLSKGESEAVIFANFIAGRSSLQIDLAIATEHSAIVVEVKGYVLPVTGGLNGPWTQHIPDGDTRKLGEKNPYMQASDARHAVVDALAASTSKAREELRRSLKSVLCVFPSVPPGSKIPHGDYKAWIGDYARLRELIEHAVHEPIPLDAWRKLAHDLRLESSNAAKVTEDSLLLEAYRSQFKALRIARSQPHVEIRASKNDGPISEPELISQMVDGHQFQVVGGSGCGKSLLFERLGSAACDAGLLPIALPAHRFESDLEPLLRRAVSTCTNEGPARMFRASGAAGSPVILLVDALNECPASNQASLIEALQAARLKFGVRVIISSQKRIALPAALAGEVVHLAQPDRETAKRIIELRLSRSLRANEEQGLDIVATANDAAILSEVIRVPAAADSRYALYRAFARRQLSGQPDSAVAYSALAALSAHMHEHFAASIPSASAYRILSQHSYDRSHPGSIEKLALGSGLILDLDGFIRFRHELIADFFSAELLLTRHREASALGTDLARPLYRQLAEFAIGGCATAREVGDALRAGSTSELLLTSLRGVCGSPAREWSLSQCRKLLDQLVDRFTRVRIEVAETTVEAGRFPGLRGNFSDSPIYDDELRPYLEVLPFMIEAGLLPAILEALRKIDSHLVSESERLRNLYPVWRLRWHSEVLGTVYGAVWACGDDAFHRIFQAARMSSFGKKWHQRETYDRIVEELAAPSTRSAGEMFFLIEALLGFDDYDGAPPATLLDIMAHAWDQRIYHLSLHAIDLGQRFGRRLDDHSRKLVGELLESWLSNSNPILNGMIFEVLSMIGCWTPSVSLEDAVAGYKGVLAMSPSDATSDQALTLYIRTIDHPDNETFAQAFYDELTEEERQKLFALAAGSNDRISMFTAFVLAEIAKAPCPEAVPALLRHSVAPETDTMSIQDSVSIFANAVGGLAMLGVELPELARGESEAAIAWRKTAELIHGLNSRDPPGNLAEVWNELETLAAYALDPVCRLEDSGAHWIKVKSGFLQAFPEGVIRLCRKALHSDYAPTSIFGFRAGGMREILELHRGYALDALAVHGAPSDLDLLRPWLDDRKLGERALRTARNLERRSHAACQTDTS